MTIRRPLVGGNWKMNTSLDRAGALARDVAAGCAGLADRCDVVLYPPFPYLDTVRRALEGSEVQLGAQDFWPAGSGAFTGEVGLEMLRDLDVTAALVGHSERRHVVGEDDVRINAKVLAGLAAGLRIVLCLGETQQQRDAGQTGHVVVAQLRAGLRGVRGPDVARLSVAYEPVWAIGTGRVATPRDAADVHAVIRSAVSELHGPDAAASVRIQYGGSVKATDAAGLFAEPQIDGGLIGGASLDPRQFVAIVRAAAESAAPVHKAP